MAATGWSRSAHRPAGQDLTDQPELGLELSQVRLAIGGRTLLHLHEHIAPGEILTVMGASGSGKSSLLAFVGGYLDPEIEASGRIVLKGVDITNRDLATRNVGILFQDPLLFPHMDIAENLRFALPRATPDRAAVIADALTSIGLSGFEKRDPATLSGGQKSRVALMRVLLSKPSALLLDEPFASLDAGLRAEMRALVFTAARTYQLPVLLVTHDEADAQAAGGRVIQLSSRPPGD